MKQCLVVSAVLGREFLSPSWSSQSISPYSGLIALAHGTGRGNRAPTGGAVQSVEGSAIALGTPY